MRATLALQATNNGRHAQRHTSCVPRAHISLHVGLVRQQARREPGRIPRRPARLGRWGTGTPRAGGQPLSGPGRPSARPSVSSDESSGPLESRTRTQRLEDRLIPTGLLESGGKRKRARWLRRALCRTEAASKTPCYTPQTPGVSSHPRGRMTLVPFGHGCRTPAHATAGLRIS